MLYPQNGERILTVDSVMSIHPMYSVGRVEDVISVGQRQ